MLPGFYNKGEVHRMVKKLRPGNIFYSTNNLGSKYKYLYCGNVGRTAQGNRLLYDVESKQTFVVETEWIKYRKIELVINDAGFPAMAIYTANRIKEEWRKNNVQE